MTGKIKFFNDTKGFGFIVDSETGEDIFVHATGKKDKKQPFAIDDKVEYEITQGDKGIMAVNVFKV